MASLPDRDRFKKKCIGIPEAVESNRICHNSVLNGFGQDLRHCLAYVPLSRDMACRVLVRPQMSSIGLMGRFATGKGLCSVLPRLISPF